MLGHGVLCPDVQSLSPVAHLLREVPVPLAREVLVRTICGQVQRGAETHSLRED